MKVRKRFADKMLIVEHWITQMALLKVHVFHTCGNMLEITKLPKVAGIFPCVIMNTEHNLIPCLMEDRFNGSALQINWH